MFKITASLTLTVLLPFLFRVTDASRNIVVGKFSGQPVDNVFWSDGVCFAPVKNVKAGDTIEFRHGVNHNVWSLSDEQAFFDCDFNGDSSSLVGAQTKSPYIYRVTEEDVRTKTSLFFACGVGGHCDGGQRLRVNLLQGNINDFDESVVESKFALGIDDARCDAVNRGEADLNWESSSDNEMSECSDPSSFTDLLDGRKYWYSSCLSGPITMTPGGVINQKSIVNYPFPRDRRVVLGNRVWEFVKGDPDDGLEPVYVNELYVHHILGGVVKGNGAESIRRFDEDASFPLPYGKLSGNFDNVVTFHLIDLRQVSRDNDAWLECVECRCADGDTTSGGVYGGGSGGISCCSNCTSLVTPTVDYRMRYNVTWSEVDDFLERIDGKEIRPIASLSADGANSIGKNVEFDVPHHSELPLEHRHPTDPFLQVLTLEGTLQDIFNKNSDFQPSEAGTEKLEDDGSFVEIHRCFGHMHIGGVNLRLEDAETSEVICSSDATYGTNPATNDGFITSLSVVNFDAENPAVVHKNQKLRLISTYNATVAHSGVMALFNLAVAELPKGHGLDKDEAQALTVDLCLPSKCDASALPDWCVDDLENTPFCTNLEMCTCDDFLSRQFVPGCGKTMNFSRFGSRKVAVNSLCAKTCGCSADGASDVVAATLKAKVDRVCSYNTAECRTFLSNLYGCSQKDALPGSEELDAHVRSLLLERGTKIVSDFAKIGNPFMYKETDDVTDVRACGDKDGDGDSESSVEDGDVESVKEEDSAGHMISHGSLFVSVSLVLGILNFA